MQFSRYLYFVLFNSLPLKVEWVVRSSSLPWVALNLATEKEAKALLERCLIMSFCKMLGIALSFISTQNYVYYIVGANSFICTIVSGTNNSIYLKLVPINLLTHEVSSVLILLQSIISMNPRSVSIKFGLEVWAEGDSNDLFHQNLKQVGT